MTRRALVTGVVGGIGAAIAQRLDAAGHAVTVTDLPGPDLERRAAELGLPFAPCDLGDPGQAERLLADLAAGGGLPEIVVSAAGGVCGQTGQPVEEVADEDWRAVFAANVDSAFHLARGIAPAMKTAGWGRIVTISSGAGLRPSLTRIQAYCAAKHALVGLTKQLALELGPAGITVNSVAPGFVISNPSTERQWESYGAEGQARLVERIHTRRLGRPEDIAAAVAFFVAEEVEWVTGQVLSVDGGVA
ncbi:MAG: SDR family NAD(P)-dependent oxidoreductase [Pseudomonadota bacterium]